MQRPLVWHKSTRPSSSSTCFPSLFPTSRDDWSLAALPSSPLDVEVLRIMSDQAVGNGESTKQVVETATTVAGTVAIGAVIGFLFLVVLPIFVGLQFIAGLPNKFIDVYKTNYPEEYEQLLAKSKADWEEGDELTGKIEDNIVDDAEVEFDFEEANALGFVAMYTILTKGDEEKSRQALKEFLAKSFIDDEELIEQCTDTILQQVKELDSDENADIDITKL